MRGKRGQWSILVPIILTVISGLTGIFLLAAVISMLKFIIAIIVGIATFVYLPQLFRKAGISKDISLIAGGVFSILVMIFIAKLNILLMTVAFIGMVIAFSFFSWMVPGFSFWGILGKAKKWLK